MVLAIPALSYTVFNRITDMGSFKLLTLSGLN